MRRGICLRVAVGFLIASTQVTECVSATPLVFTGERKGDRLGESVACSDASIGSHRRSMIAATAPGSVSGRGKVFIYDPEAPSTKPQVLAIGARRSECRFGNALSFVPDFNGDGVDDLALSAICNGDTITREVLALRSIRTGPAIRYSLCGSIRHHAEVAAIGRPIEGSGTTGFVLQHTGKLEGTWYRVIMASPHNCSLTGVAELPSIEPAVSRAMSEPLSSKCQAHLRGRLRSLELLSDPSAGGEKGAIEVGYRPLQAQNAIARALVVAGAGDLSSGGFSSGTEEATSGTNSGGLIEGGDGQIGRQTSLEIFPGSAGLPAPDVDQSKGPNAYVTLPQVSVSLSESQKKRAVKLLMNRGTSKQRAELAVENPNNFVTTYIVTVVTERAGVAAAAVVLKSNALSARSASKIRKYRTRRDRVSIGRLTPGSTVSVSYRVEISLKKPRAVLGLTKPSETKRVRVP